MKRTILLTGLLLFIETFFLCTCGDDPISFRKETGAPHAFVCDSVVNNPSLQDTSFFSKCDTVHTGDSLTFFGAVIPPDTRVKGVLWNFADGNLDSMPVANHAYAKGGTYNAIFSIYDSLGHLLSDTVVIYVNTPPDSVIILSPVDSAIGQPLVPKLEWKGYDRDDFDSILVYSVIIFKGNAPADTVVYWGLTTSIDLNRGLEKDQKIAWYVLAKDKFGDVIASDTFHFSTIGTDDAKRVKLLSSISVSSGYLIPNTAPVADSLWDTVSYSTTAITLTPYAIDTLSAIVIGSESVKSGNSCAPISLVVGQTTIAVKVTSADRKIMKTYIVSVIRLPNPNFLLSLLLISKGTLQRQEAPFPDTLRDTVSFLDSSIILTPVVPDTPSSITLNGVATKSSTASLPIPLKVGINKIFIRVLAPDGSWDKTYVLLVIRKPDSAILLTNPPTGVSAKGISASAIRISWDDLYNATFYTIVRSASLADIFKQIGTSSSNSYIDTGLDSGSTWYYRVSASNSKGGTDFSAPVTATTFKKPFFISHPLSQSIFEGRKAIFSVIAGGIPAPAYQWQKNGTNIAFGASAACTTGVLSLSDNNSRYRCIIRNDLGAETSHEAVLTVDSLFTKPFIVSQPHDTAVVVGSDIALVIIDTGSYTTVQWRKNGANMPWATSDTLRLGNVQTADAGIYSVKLWNKLDSAISTPFRLRVLPKVPVGLSARARSAWSIGLSWNQTKAASWYRLLRASETGSFASICSTSQLYFIDTPLTEGASCVYRIRGGNGDGESDLSDPVYASTWKGPTIINQSHDTTVNEGQPLTLWVEATGNPSCTYQWKRNNINISNATSSTYRLEPVTAADSGDYVITVSNIVRSVNSNSIRVRVNPILIVLFNGQGATTPPDPIVKAIIPPATRIDSLPTPPLKTGYIFGGWFTEPDGAGTEFRASTPVTESIMVYAKWIGYSYTVTFNSQSATTPADPSSITVASPATNVGKLPTPPSKTNSIFGGWFTEPNGEGVAFTASTAVTKNITVYAKWNINAYTVTFDDEGATTPPNPTSITVTLPATTTGTLPTPPQKKGYIFGGWYTQPNGQGSPFTANSPVTATMTVYAKWNSYSYTVTFDGQGGTPQTITKSVSSPATTVGSLPTEPTRTGYTFGGWYTATGGNGTEFTASTVVTGNISVFAKWTINTYTVTFDANYGSPTPSNQNVNYNGLVTKPTDPTRTGYDFTGWAKGDGTLWNFGSDRVTGNTYLYANWTIKTYTIAFEANGGSPEPPQQPVNYNGKVTKPTQDPTLQGYNFDCWINENGIQWDFNNDIVTRNITLTAKWTAITYTVTFNANGGSTVPSQTVKYNGYVNKPANPTRGTDIFFGWFTDPELTNEWNFESDIVTGDITLYAKWACTVTFDSNGGSTVPSQIVEYNGYVNKPANPTRGTDIFFRWFTDPELTNEWNFESDKVTGNMTLYAHWITGAFGDQ